MRSRRSVIECACEQGRSKSRKPGRTSLDRSATERKARGRLEAIDPPHKIRRGGRSSNEQAGFEPVGRPLAYLPRRNKAAKGQTNPRSVVGRSTSFTEAQDRPARSRPYGTDSGTPPRMRPVTHDRVRSTVAGANDVSRRRRGVAPNTAGATKRCSGMSHEGWLPSDKREPSIGKR